MRRSDLTCFKIHSNPKTRKEYCSCSPDITPSSIELRIYWTSYQDLSKYWMRLWLTGVSGFSCVRSLITETNRHSTSEFWTLYSPVRAVSRSSVPNRWIITYKRNDVVFIYPRRRIKAIISPMWSYSGEGYQQVRYSLPPPPFIQLERVLH